MAPNVLPRPNELVDPGTPNTLSADALARPVHGGVDDDPRVRPGAGSDRSQPRPPRRERDRGPGGAAVAFELLGRH
jgi:hypothetical protein